MERPAPACGLLLLRPGPGTSSVQPAFGLRRPVQWLGHHKGQPRSCSAGPGGAGSCKGQGVHGATTGQNSPQAGTDPGPGGFRAAGAGGECARGLGCPVSLSTPAAGTLSSALQSVLLLTDFHPLLSSVRAAHLSAGPASAHSLPLCHPVWRAGVPPRTGEGCPEWCQAAAGAPSLDSRRGCGQCRRGRPQRGALAAADAGVLSPRSCSSGPCSSPS